MIANTIQRVRWREVKNPVGEWCVWVYMCVKYPALAGSRR